LNTLCVIYERTPNEWLRHVVGTFGANYERTLRVFSKSYPQGTLKSTLRSFSQFAQQSS
jgi:hypothetical protein